MRVEIINPITDRKWDLQTGEHPEASIFHTSAWAKVLTSTYRHRAVYLRFSHRGQVAALVPLMDVRSLITGARGVCLPFSDSCAPLIFAGCDQDELQRTLAQTGRDFGWRFIELRGGNHSGDTDVATPFLGHTIDLRCGCTAAYDQVSDSGKRAIRKATREDVAVRIQRDLGGMNEFLTLHALTRQRHGLPPQPRQFFMSILEHIVSLGTGFMATATVRGSAVASAVFFHWKHKGTFKFSASDNRFQALRGNNFAMWEGIRTLIRDGAQTLDLGRTSVSNHGLIQYKRGWGGVEAPLPYTRIDPHGREIRGFSDRSTGAHTGVFRAMPAGLNRLAGSILYPHLD